MNTLLDRIIDEHGLIICGLPELTPSDNTSRGLESRDLKVAVVSGPCPVTHLPSRSGRSGDDREDARSETPHGLPQGWPLARLYLVGPVQDACRLGTLQEISVSTRVTRAAWVKHSARTTGGCLTYLH